jgi:Type IV pilus assembly protein PilM
VSKFISIDLEPQGLFAVAGAVSRGTAKVEKAIAWAGTETEGGPPALTVDSAKQIGEQLKERLRSAGVSHAPVVVTVGRDRIVLKEVRYPAVPLHEEPNIVRFQALKELSDAPDDVVLDYVPLSNGAGAGERRSMAIVVRKDLFAAIQAMCTAANLKLAAVTPRPYALAAGLRQAFATSVTTPPESKADAVAILTLGPGGGEFNVVRDGEVTFTVAVPAPVVASEPMLLSQIRRNLATYAGSNPAHPVQALYIAEADEGAGWAERFRSTLGIPVHSYDPLAGSVPSIPEPMRGRFAGAAGLLAAQSTPLPINFAAPRQPKQDADPKRGQLMIAALVAMLLLAACGVGGYFILDSADDNIDRLTTSRADKKKKVEESEPDLKRLEAVNGWRGRRVVWLDELFEMTERFPSSPPPGFYMSSFTAKAMPADPKTGKQTNQASFNVKLSAHNGDPVTALLTSINRDNTDPKSKYYVGVDKTIGGPTQGDREAKDYTLFGFINRRDPDKYDRNPKFTTPSRAKYPPAPGSAVKETRDPGEKEAIATEEGKDREAPPPKEKVVVDDEE